MHVAAGGGRASAVSALLTKGADPGVATRTGDTPLHLACQNGHVTTVSVHGHTYMYTVHCVSL